ncbi:Endochitinase B1 [Epichloe bromicola]|uniref:Endochitinase B1 n=1 Tax=Epichloe bromicola TaxID=79588 RepID=A0ABQ0CH88_9HYPO
MKLVLFSLCLSAAAATPIPTTPKLIDYKAGGLKVGDVKVPVNVLGLQTENVDALNGMFAGNKASGNHIP